MTRMPEEWFVRVHDKEYGPVDLDDSQEWQGDGRVIATNELRRSERRRIGPRSGDARALPESTADQNCSRARAFRARTFSQIIGDTVRLYFRGFRAIFRARPARGLPALALQALPPLCQCARRTSDHPHLAVGQQRRVVALPAVLVDVARLPRRIAIRRGGCGRRADAAAGGHVAAGWRIGDGSRSSVSSFTAATFSGRCCRSSRWRSSPPRLIPGVLLALFALAFQVYMVGRLFINFMFWQQSCTFGDLEGVGGVARQQRARAQPPGRSRAWNARSIAAPFSRRFS